MEKANFLLTGRRHFFVLFFFV